MRDNIKSSPSVHSEFCGFYEREEVYLISLINNGITVKITNFGSTITAIYAPDRNGTCKNIVAGFANIASYADNPHYMGCVLGRYAGRIAGGSYQYNNETIRLSQNEHQNHLHGGFSGLSSKVWKVKSYIRNDESVGVIMQYLSENGEEGYPGNLWIDIKYVLNNTNQLSITYSATTDKPTPVNLSNHSYFNLSGFENGQILGHLLYVDAKYFTEKNAENLPTGKVLPLADLPMDFSVPKEIGRDIKKLTADGGYDHNFVLCKHLPGEMCRSACLYDPQSGRILNLYTDQPAIQLYTANFWDNSILGAQGVYYQKHGAVALETQNFPDAPNHPGFPNAILKPGEKYTTKTIYEFAVE
jgi:aldose 1-epimerase